MQSEECLRRVRPLVRERVPAELRAFQWESFSFQSKLWYTGHTEYADSVVNFRCEGGRLVEFQRTPR